MELEFNQEINDIIENREEFSLLLIWVNKIEFDEVARKRL